MTRFAPLSANQVDALTSEQLASMIDHTLLSPTASAQDIDVLCQQAQQLSTASVCVHPIWVPRAVQQLQDTAVKICTVVGFPSGAHTPEVKAFETEQAISNGATEIDMVIHQAAALANDGDALRADIAAVVAAAKDHDVIVKVILETATLTEQAKILACEAAVDVGAHFVKTSTGFGAGGATVDDVELLRETVGSQLGVKASGGIRTRQDAIDMLRAGATRLGASATYAIVS